METPGQLQFADLESADESKVERSVNRSASPTSVPTCSAIIFHEGIAFP